jgi:hypothetical protein
LLNTRSLNQWTQSLMILLHISSGATHDVWSWWKSSACIALSPHELKIMNIMAGAHLQSHQKSKRRSLFQWYSGSSGLSNLCDFRLNLQMPEKK